MAGGRRGEGTRLKILNLIESNYEFSGISREYSGGWREEGGGGRREDPLDGINFGRNTLQIALILFATALNVRY